MKEIRIRKLDENIYYQLSKEAKEKNISLNKYIKDLLETHTIKKEVMNLDEKYQNLLKDILVMYEHQLDKSNSLIEENNALLRKLIKENRNEY